MKLSDGRKRGARFRKRALQESAKKTRPTLKRAAAELQGTVLNDHRIDDSPTVLQAKNSRDNESVGRDYNLLWLRGARTG